MSEARTGLTSDKGAEPETAELQRLYVEHAVEAEKAKQLLAAQGTASLAFLEADLKAGVIWNEIQKSLATLRPPAMNAQQAQAYKDATDNLIYLKREQVQITYFTWVLLAALYLLARANTNETWLLKPGAAAVGALSVLTVLWFGWSIQRLQWRLKYIYRTYFTKLEEVELCLKAGPWHWAQTGVLAVVCAAAAYFTFHVIR